MNAPELSNALREIADKLQEVENEETGFSRFPDEAELIRTLARVVDGKDLWRAFGSPGDWGYNAPVGKGLALALRRAQAAAQQEKEKSNV